MSLQANLYCFLQLHTACVHNNNVLVFQNYLIVSSLLLISLWLKHTIFSSQCELSYLSAQISFFGI